MTGWLLIIILLVLGGVLATIGDRLGSLVGKARLSIFKLRPKRTAVVITVLTGSLISALSLGLLLLVSRQLRVGLFELSDLQYKLKSTRELYIEREKELKQIQQNLIAFRRGNVVLSSGQTLATLTVKLKSDNQAKSLIDRLLQEANLEAFRRVRPGESPNRQILLVPKTDIQRLERIISKKGSWVVNFRSAANVLRGEQFVYAFPEVRPNITIVKEGEVLAKTWIEEDERSSDAIRKRLNLLLASAFAEIKRRGSLRSGLQFDANSMNKLGTAMLKRSSGRVELTAVALQTSDTAEPIAVVLNRASKN